MCRLGFEMDVTPIYTLQCYQLLCTPIPCATSMIHLRDQLEILDCCYTGTNHAIVCTIKVKKLHIISKSILVHTALHKDCRKHATYQQEQHCFTHQSTKRHWYIHSLCCASFGSSLAVNTALMVSNDHFWFPKDPKGRNNDGKEKSQVGSLEQQVSTKHKAFFALFNFLGRAADLL